MVPIDSRQSSIMRRGQAKRHCGRRCLDSAHLRLSPSGGRLPHRLLAAWGDSTPVSANDLRMSGCVGKRIGVDLRTGHVVLVSHLSQRTFSPCSPTLSPPKAPGALLPHRARRAALLGVLRRPPPKRQHEARLLDGRAALRCLVRAPQPRAQRNQPPGGCHPRPAALRNTLRPERQAALGGAAHVL